MIRDQWQRMGKKNFGTINICKHYQTSARHLGLKNRWIFHQDNDPKHNAGVVKEWIV